MRSFVLFFLLLGAAPAGVPAPAATDLAFLAGCWRLVRGDRVIDEQWMAPAGGTLLGMSRTIVAGRTVEHEFMQIREQEGGVYYVAQPSGQPEASFKLVRRAPREAVFEDPAHDFPQRIIYRREGGALRARIEGTAKGKASAVDFPYARVPCAQ